MFRIVRGMSRVSVVAAVALCMVTTDMAQGAGPNIVADNGVANSIYSSESRTQIADAGYAVLDTLPTKKEIAQIADKSARMLLSKIVDLAERGAQAEWASDQELEQVARDLEFVVLGFEASTQNNTLANTLSETQTTLADTDPFQCTRLRNGCIVEGCGTGTTWPCFCCVPCNIAFLACIAKPLIPGT